MANVTFVQPDGRAQSVEIEEGFSVMQAANNNDIPGIAGECGGCVSCATCKVEVDAAWIARIPASTELETSLIEDEDANVRLSCQIMMTPELDGLVVHVPASQYR